MRPASRLNEEFAYESGHGVLRRMREGEIREDRVERALINLDRRDYIEVEVSGEAQYMGIEFDSPEEAQAAYERATVRE